LIGLGGIWITVGAILVAGLLSTLGRALVHATRAGIEQFVARHGGGEVPPRVSLILSDDDHHVAALALVQIVLVLVAVVELVAWVAAVRGMESPGVVDATIGIGFGTLATWVVAVVVPMAIAEHAAERTVVVWAWLIRSVGIAAVPLGPGIRFVMEVVRRLSGQDRPTAAAALEAELMSVVEEGEREGRIDEVERDMIEAVVEFRSTTVEQIMTPRTEMMALEYTDDLGAIKEYCRESGHSRVPVYEENLDHIVGILYLKDLLRWLIEHGTDSDEEFALKDVVRDATFVPETKTVRELLGELLEAKVHIAIVADEYGGTSGLVTIEDIIEEIVGEIQDEYEPEEEGEAPVVVDLERRIAEIDARTEIDDANDELESLGVELPEAGDYDTVGGFVVVAMGRIPEVGEHFEHDRLMITVLDAEPTRVKRVRIEVIPEDEPAGDDSAPAGSEQAVK
jgi:magnesium and cobalt exporter, CNNM family